jgi:aryl-alcohol dehydrogenase
VHRRKTMAKSGTTRGLRFQGAVVRAKGGKFLMEELTLAPPGPEEVLIKVSAAGVCHTDHIIREQYFPTPLPCVLGHEGSGVVEEVGEAVKTLKPGDRVAVTYLSCGHCTQCESGESSYCRRFFELNFGGARLDGTTSITDEAGASVHDHFFGQSTFGTLAIAHRRNCVKVRDDVPLELVGPLGCGIQTGAGAILNSFRIRSGTSVAVFGAGAVGLSAVMAARVAAIDVVDSRLELAKTLGATHTINAKRTDAVKEVQEITKGGARYSLETSGLPAVLRQALDALGVRGECGIIGAAPLGTEASFDIISHLVMGKTMRGICEGDSQPNAFIPQLLELYLQGRFPFDKLVKYYPFANINEAIDDSLSGSTIKAILKMPA